MSGSAHSVEERVCAGDQQRGGVGGVERGDGLSHAVHDLGLHLVEDRGEQLGLVGELVVEAPRVSPASAATRSVPTAA